MKADVEQLVTLQRSVAADTKTIYCFPGAGDSVTCFLPLADSLGASFTVHGIQPRGLEGISAPHSSVEQVVRDNIDAVRRIHPGGPYKLLGHSFGGWVAFEMALRLSADAQNVDTLLLLDADPPTADDRQAGTITRVDALLELVRNLEDKAARRLSLGRSEFEGLSEDAQLRALMNAMKAAGLFPHAATLPSIARLVEVFEANLRTVYMPAQPLPGDILLVHPAIDSATGEEHAAGEDSAHAWKPYAAGVQRAVVPGTHMRMLVSPGVGGIAEAVHRVW